MGTIEEPLVAHSLPKLVFKLRFIIQIVCLVLASLVSYLSFTFSRDNTPSGNDLLEIVSQALSRGYHLAQIELSSFDHVVRSEISDAGFENERSSLTIDASAVEASLRQASHIADYRLIMFAGTPRLRVTPHEAIAVVRDIENLEKPIYVSTEGVLFSAPDDVVRSARPHILSIEASEAPQNVPELIAAIDHNGLSLSRISSARWIGGRRYDLTLASGHTILLPEEPARIANALSRAQELLARIDPNLPALHLNIDARIVDRLFVRPKAPENAQEENFGP